MMVAQMDLFGGSQEPKAIPPKVSVERKAKFPTCWADCLLCGKEPHSYHRRLYRLCGLPGRENAMVFESDGICQRARVAARMKEPAPQGPGWDDY